MSDEIKQSINDLTNMIEGKHMRLDSILSKIIEREIITIQTIVLHINS